MTVQNDFNALINAIIDNLEEMGVTNVSFESETGIMGLIDRILEIETGSSIEVPTVIDCVMTLPGPNTTITVGDSYTCSGALRGSYNNFSFKIGGATIYAYNHDDLLGQAVTNSDGNFTINGMYHKATSSVSYSLRFLATDIFLSSTLTGSTTRPVNKKSITLSQSINDTWISTPDEYSINIGSQYQDAPITLMIDSQRYDMEYVDENGVVTFDISNLTGVNECQLVVETNDVFSNAQSNTFNISIGVNIYINPELQITSDKDILSYADNESATLTAKIKSDATEISSVNIPLTYREDPVLTATKSGITITEQNNLYLCESVNTDGYIVFDMDAEQTETSFTISNVTANSVDSDAKCTLVQYYHGEGTVTYSWELLDTNNFGNGDYIIRIKDGNIDVYKNGIHVANQSLSEGYKLGFGIYGYSFDISDINIERIINNGLNTGVYASRGVGDVAITAKYGTLVSKIFSISDIYYYDSLTVDKQRYTTVSGSPTLTYSSNGLNVDTSVAQVGLVKNNFLTLPSDYEAEITVTTVPSNEGRTGICFDDLLLDGSSINTVFYKLSNTSNKGSTNTVILANTVVKIRKQSDTFTVYFDDVQKWSGTISDDNHLQQFRTYRNRSTTFKDLKIKAL